MRNAGLLDRCGGRNDEAWLAGCETVVVTAGAARRNIFWECIAWLQEKYGAEFREHRYRDEDVEFRLPNLLINLDLRPVPGRNRTRVRLARPDRFLRKAGDIGGRQVLPDSPGCSR